MLKMKISPVVLFTYNRIEHTIKTIEALKKNTLAIKSELYVYSDGPKYKMDEKTIIELREYLKNIKGFKKVTIIEQTKNLGLAKSIINGVSKIIERFGRIIVLEDDIKTSPAFLTFMNEALDFYENKKNIWSISGFCPNIRIPRYYNENVFLSLRASSWGWATWKDRWNKNDWTVSDFNSFKKNKKIQKEFNKGGDDLTPMLYSQQKNEIDSWAIRWCYSQFKYKGFTVYPVNTLVQNIGLDGSGVHWNPIFKKRIITPYKKNYYPFNLVVEKDDVIIYKFKNYYSQSKFKKLLINTLHTLKLLDSLKIILKR